MKRLIGFFCFLIILGAFLLTFVSAEFSEKLNGAASEFSLVKCENYPMCGETNSWCDNADINKDKYVNAKDYDIIDFCFDNWGICTDENKSIFALSDINKDGIVNADDYFIIDTWNIKQGCAPDNNMCAGADINNDGYVNAKDYDIIDFCFDNWGICTDENKSIFALSDINKDGIVNADDYFIIDSAKIKYPMVPKGIICIKDPYLTKIETDFNLILEANVSDEGSISFIKYENYTMENTTGVLGLNAMGIFFKIDADKSITDNLGQSILKVTYTDADVAAANVDEESLRLYFFNENSGNWTAYDSPIGGG